MPCCGSFSDVAARIAVPAPARATTPTAVQNHHLLVIGFYLVNLGWALLLLRSNAANVTSPTAGVEVLATKLGTLLLLLGVAHMINLLVFHKIRQAGKQTA